jgi:hypothetical protein
MTRPRPIVRGVIVCGALAALASCGSARTYEQSYAGYTNSWLFRARYPAVDRLFNAFDFGHAILSETLLRHPTDAARRLEGPLYRQLTCDVLRRPPRVPLEERAVGPTYGTTIPEAVATFEWAHMLHRQVYDIIASEPFSLERRDQRIAAALRYYRSRSDLALSTVPKSMELMEGQPYSLAFRQAAPKFNGLIWSYHWLQMAVYDAMLTAPDPPTRREMVARDVEQFMQMTTESGKFAPTEMPMSPAIAPVFTERYPDAAIIFDNLHSLHDVVSDILASPKVPTGQKRAAVLTAIAHYRDSTSFTTTRDEWLSMSRDMGGVDTTRLGAGTADCR